VKSESGFLFGRAGDRFAPKLTSLQPIGLARWNSSQSARGEGQVSGGASNFGQPLRFLSGYVFKMKENTLVIFAFGP
jgi:hypothetical protein